MLDTTILLLLVLIEFMNSTISLAIMADVSLYPSIPHEVGLKTLKEVLDKREQHTIPESELLRIVDFVLKNNYFEFNGQIKLQILVKILVKVSAKSNKIITGFLTAQNLKLIGEK